MAGYSRNVLRHQTPTASCYVVVPREVTDFWEVQGIESGAINTGDSVLFWSRASGLSELKRRHCRGLSQFHIVRAGRCHV
jgi:hypothetical protein